MPRSDASDFYQRTRDAKKVMVLDLGFLGDTVHLLPALWMVRQAYSKAELHVTVASHITSLMQCVPWVDKTWGYMRYPRHATLRENLRMVTALRREKFDAVININGSDRSSWLTFLSGAGERLGRVPSDGGPWFWRQMFSSHVSYPTMQEPVYIQNCRCLEMAGLPPIPPEFHTEIDPVGLDKAKIASQEKSNYFHISPFTTADGKELAPKQLAELMEMLGIYFPEKKLVISCSPTEREQKKLDELFTRLPHRPWRVLAGNLGLNELAAVIQHSALHFCGDTGTLHLAVMTRTPVVTWFLPKPGLRQWVPTNDNCRVVLGRQIPDSPFLGQIKTMDLIDAAKMILVGSARNA